MRGAAGDFRMVRADNIACSTIPHVRLRVHPEAYGVGGTTTTVRCKGVSWRGELGRGSLGGRVCDVVVTPCNLHRLAITQPLIDSFLLLCQG